MGQSLEKRKEGFPRERRFKTLSTSSSSTFNRPQLRQPWAFIARIYRFLFVREGASIQQVIVARIGELLDQIIAASYRSTRALTVLIHTALLIYCGATWTTFAKPDSFFARDWISERYTDIPLAPVSVEGKKVFSYSGGAWEHDYSSVERILSSATRRRLGSEETETLTKAIVTTARDHQVDPVFVASLVKHESGFRRSVVSSAGAIGLMQLLPSTGQFVCSLQQSSWGGSRRLCTPSYNLKLGITYLKHLLQQFPHDLSHVLIAYNWGPGNLQRALRNRRTIPNGPVRYARSILRDYASARSSQTGTIAASREKRPLNPKREQTRPTKKMPRSPESEGTTKRLVF